MHLRILIFILVSLSIKGAYGQQLPAAFDMDIPWVTGYDSMIPTPDDILGHTIGTRHTVPHQIVDYFKAVAAVSDRIVLEEHARSYENRPLVHAIVTSPANHARLESIRSQHVRLSESPDEISDEMLAGLPVVVYQGYSIHGNEARGAQVIGGSIFEANLDVTHPLGYSFRSSIPVFRNSSTFLEPSDVPGETVAVYAEEPLLSGYISEEQLELMPGSAVHIAKPYGSGSVILFMDNSNFRAFWYGTSRLFMNAVFLGGTF